QRQPEPHRPEAGHAVVAGDLMLHFQEGSRGRRSIAAGGSGLTLVEGLIALVVLTICILGLAENFPAGSRSEVAARMQTTGCQYANETFEQLRGLPKTDASLSLGRHPASDYDSLGASKAWRRYYVVSQMASPLDSLYKVETTVLWQ